MLKAAIDKFLRVSSADNQREVWRRRSVLFLSVAYLVSNLLIGGMTMLVSGLTPTLLVIPCMVPFLVLAPFIVAWGGRVSTAGVVLLIPGTLGTLGYVLMSGGLESPGLILLIGAPVVSALLLGPLSVVWTTLALLLILCGLHLLHPSSVHSAQGLMDLVMVCMGFAMLGQFAAMVTAVTRQMIILSLEAREVAERANKAKSDFLANVSHEIRTPLNGVVAMAESMSSDDISDGQREKLAVIQESGALLLRVINDVLDVSKIEASAMTLEKRAFDLGHIASVAAQLYRIQAESKGLDFRVTLSDGLETMRIGDEHRVLQILGNLIGNAVKFTSQGFVHVEIFESSVGVRISVIDSGLGMTPEQAEAVLQPFVQADSSTTRSFGGTGLGLSIVNGLTQAMGGRIEVETTPGEGTAFHIDLPLAQASSMHPPLEHQSRRKRRAAVDVPDYRDRKFLLVDDNAVNIRVLKALLVPTSARTVEAIGGVEAIELASVEHFDVILMDISMPGVDGIEAAERIRRTCPKNRTTPMIAATAHALEHEAEMFSSYGFEATLGKPISAERLFATIDLALAKSGSTADEQVFSA